MAESDQAIRDIVAQLTAASQPDPQPQMAALMMSPEPVRSNFAMMPIADQMIALARGQLASQPQRLPQDTEPSDSLAMGVDPSTSNPVSNVVGGLARGIGKVFMAPGQALQSTTPMTSDDMIKPAADLAMMTTLGAGAVPQDANA